MFILKFRGDVAVTTPVDSLPTNISTITPGWAIPETVILGLLTVIFDEGLVIIGFNGIAMPVETETLLSLPAVSFEVTA
ncbi:MAG: hypothetical protein Q7K21_00340 [Elusimicrobiota bacterium]|nr:hypothetical protein [Elusimicrobiota bacterium]